jgi:hypothetical protein
MTIRQHAEKAVDYSIRVALTSIVALPVWFCAWWATGLPPGGDASELDPTSDRISQILGIAGFVFISPAYACAVLLSWLHVPSGVLFSLVYWLAAVVSVPAVWGTVIYGSVQLYRHVVSNAERPTRRRSEGPAAPRSSFR